LLLPFTRGLGPSYETKSNKSLGVRVPSSGWTPLLGFVEKYHYNLRRFRGKKVVATNNYFFDLTRTSFHFAAVGVSLWFLGVKCW
jgi:hypothetical protein